MPLVTQPTVQAVAQALGHFLRQGAVLGLATYLVGRTVGPSAGTRYLLGVACLAAMAAMPVLTTLYLLRASASTLAVAAIPVVARRAAAPDSWMGATASGSASSWAPSTVVVSVWLTGVVVLSLRLLGGWVVTRRFVNRARGPVAADLRAAVERVSRRLGLSRLVEVCESPAIVGPMLIGWIKPVVIVPTAALSNLTPAQVEALLAHELAHVRRHDYLVNLLQSGVETVLFYHPAVWLVSREVRQAREECCDDLAVAVSDRVVYVSALADLAALTAGPRLALAATDGSLLARVRRLLGGADEVGPARPGWMPAVLLVGLVAGLGPIALSSAPSASTASGARAPAVVDPSIHFARTTLEPVEGGPQAATPPEPGRVSRGSNDGGADQSPTPEQLERQRQIEAQIAKADEDVAVLRADRARLNDQQASALRDAVDQLKAERAAVLDQLAGTDPSAKQERRLKELKQQLMVAEEKLLNPLGDLGPLDAELALEAKQQRLAEAQAELGNLREQSLAEADALKKMKIERLPGTADERGADQKAQTQADGLKMKTERLPLDDEDRAALEKARAQGNEAAIEAKLGMERDRAKLETMLAEKQLTDDAFSSLEKTQAWRVEPGESRPDKVFTDPGTADLAFIHAVAASGSGAIVVLDQSTRRSVPWHDGLSVGEALGALGLSPAERADLSVARLSEMTVTWRTGKDTADQAKSERLDQAAPLRRGDVLVLGHKGK